jgi:hypothetical protein
MPTLPPTFKELKRYEKQINFLIDKKSKKKLDQTYIKNEKEIFKKYDFIRRNFNKLKREILLDKSSCIEKLDVFPSKIRKLANVNKSENKIFNLKLHILFNIYDYIHEYRDPNLKTKEDFINYSIKFDKYIFNFMYFQLFKEVIFEHEIYSSDMNLDVPRGEVELYTLLEKKKYRNLSIQKFKDYKMNINYYSTGYHNALLLFQKLYLCDYLDILKILNFKKCMFFEKISCDFSDTRLKKYNFIAPIILPKIRFSHLYDIDVEINSYYKWIKETFNDSVFEYKYVECPESDNYMMHYFLYHQQPMALEYNESDYLLYKNR